MHILVLRHSNFWNQPLFESGHELHLVYPAAGASMSDDSRYKTSYRISDWNSLEDIAAVCAAVVSANISVDAVWSPIEATQFAAGAMARMLGLEHPSLDAVLNSRDKNVMKCIASRAGIDVANTQYVKRSEFSGHTLNVARGIDYPLIVKPALGSGSVGVSLVENDDDLGAAVELLLEEAETSANNIVLEEFIQGEEFHVDAVWRDGVPWVFSIARYVTQPRLMREGAGPAMAVLLDEDSHQDLYAEVLKMHSCFNQAAGVRRGPTHLEFFRTGDGRLVFSEIATRVGGGNISTAVALKYGAGLNAAYFHELVGDEYEDLSWVKGEWPYYAWYNLVPEVAGTITALPDMEALAGHRGVLCITQIAEVGDEYRPGHTSAEWVITMVLGGDSEHEIVGLADTIRRQYPFSVERVEGSDIA